MRLLDFLREYTEALEQVKEENARLEKQAKQKKRR
jgi:hypothetical protein